MESRSRGEQITHKPSRKRFNNHQVFVFFLLYVVWCGSISWRILFFALQQLNRYSPSPRIMCRFCDEFSSSRQWRYLKRLASRSHSSRQRISPSRTGPLTFRTMERPVPPPPPSASMNSTRTWVTFPVFPVLPRTRFTFANFTGWSIVALLLLLFECSRQTGRGGGCGLWMVDGEGGHTRQG